MRDVFAPTPLNVAALAVAVLLIGGSYLLVSDPAVRYAVWLLVFSVYMLWVVLTVVGLLKPDEG